MKKIIVMLLVLVTVCSCFVACNDNGDVPEGTKLLSFSQAQSVDNIKELDGQTVSMIGYMSTLSPVSGKFMYLMNLPYQSCPFCIPNTTTLSNTIAVYAKKEFEFTDRAIQVVGTLEVGDWTDEFGYQYSYRIKDATYEILNTEDMSDELKQWQALAASGVVADIYGMYDYVNFICFWAEYTAQFGDSADYLYPDDVAGFMQPNSQYGYASDANYVNNLIARVEEVDKTAFADLVANIREAEELAAFAKAELEAGNFTKVTEYSGAFGDHRQQYKMNKVDELAHRFQTTFAGFSTWLSQWEL